MNVEYRGNVLTIRTGVKADSIPAVGLRAKDEEGNVKFILAKGNLAAVTTSGLTCNAVSETGEALVILSYDITAANKPTIEDIKEQHGDALLAANKYIPVILADVAARAQAINEIFNN